MDEKFVPLPGYGGTSDFQMGKKIGALEEQNRTLRWIISLVGMGFGFSVLWLLNCIDNKLAAIIAKLH